MPGLLGEPVVTTLVSASRRPSGLRKTTITLNSLAHRTTWLRSDLVDAGGWAYVRDCTTILLSAHCVPFGEACLPGLLGEPVVTTLVSAVPQPSWIRALGARSLCCVFQWRGTQGPLSRPRWSTFTARVTGALRSETGARRQPLRRPLFSSLLYCSRGNKHWRPYERFCLESSFALRRRGRSISAGESTQVRERDIRERPEGFLLNRLVDL